MNECEWKVSDHSEAMSDATQEEMWCSKKINLLRRGCSLDTKPWELHQSHRKVKDMKLVEVRFIKCQKKRKSITAIHPGVAQIFKSGPLWLTQSDTVIRGVMSR